MGLDVSIAYRIFLYSFSPKALLCCTDLSKKIEEDCRGEYISYEDNSFEKPIVQERVWENYDFNYDTVHEAMLSLFVVATFEGWPPLLYK